jgi:hypothetical protein
VVELRKTLRLSLDDLLSVVKEFIHASMSRSALDRLLRRRGVSRLPVEEAPVRPTKAFKAYDPGYVHIDVKYLPQMPGESQRRYLFVALIAPPVGSMRRFAPTRRPRLRGAS